MITTTELLERYGRGERDFRNLDIEDQAGTPLVGAVLDEIDLSGAFVLTSFANASLRNASFRSANVKTCDFTGADLTNADFTGAPLCSTTFRGAQMDGARFAGASFHSFSLADGDQPDW